MLGSIRLLNFLNDFFFLVSFLILKNLKHIKFQKKSKREGTETGNVLRIERRLGNIFILIVLTFPHNEKGETYHLFKSLVSSIIKGLRLALTISLFFLGNWTSRYLKLVYCHWKGLSIVFFWEIAIIWNLVQLILYQEYFLKLTTMSNSFADLI